MSSTTQTRPRTRSSLNTNLIDRSELEVVERANRTKNSKKEKVTEKNGKQQLHQVIQPGTRYLQKEVQHQLPQVSWRNLARQSQKKISKVSIRKLTKHYRERKIISAVKVIAPLMRQRTSYTLCQRGGRTCHKLGYLITTT